MGCISLVTFFRASKESNIKNIEIPVFQSFRKKILPVDIGDILQARIPIRILLRDLKVSSKGKLSVTAFFFKQYSLKSSIFII